MHSFPGLELVVVLDRPRATGGRLSEDRAPVGLFARGELYCLGFDVNLLDQGLNKRELGTNGAGTYPSVILGSYGRVSHGTQRHTEVVLSSPANRLTHVQRRE